MRLRYTAIGFAVLGLCACTQSDGLTVASAPQPSEIIDLGALVTEDLPQRFWGTRALSSLGFTEPNSFKVIPWKIGAISGSNAYYTLFNHGGPHVDAPNHESFGAGLDSYRIESFAGPLRVFDFSHLSPGRTITREMLESQGIKPGDIVIIYTAYRPPRTDADLPQYIALTYEAAEFLATLPVRAFGTDAMSLDNRADQSPINAASQIVRSAPIHHAFLSRGIPAYEQLANVDRLVGKQRMYFVGAPLNIKDGDGMIVRPVVLVF